MFQSIGNLYNDLVIYIKQLYSFYLASVTQKPPPILKKPITMPHGYTDWDYIVQLYVR